MISARWVAADQGPAKPTGFGQHGGWGPDETRPFLLLNEAGIAPSVHTRTTSLVDIAPTILAFLGLASGGMDGAPLAGFAR